MNKLIGVSGFARSGKDTFCNRACNFLNFHGETCSIYSFADALKSELDELLLKHTGISAFTEKDEEKELIRPLLVTYGTDIRRKLNLDCWIESIQDSIKFDLLRGKYVFIADVRFLNEAEWVKSLDGYLFNIKRAGVLAANKDESEQHKFFKKYIDYTISWPSFSETDIASCDDYIIKLFSDPSVGFNFFPKNKEFISMKS